MGRKRKKILKPWCWYCEREFEEEKVLIHHQKSKHFKCHICQRKLYTGPGLVIHCSQVHKETVTEIPNAFPHRNNLEMDIYGTEGIPEKDRLERERNKGAGEDATKRFKQETGIAFVPAPPGMLPMMPGMPMMPHGPHGGMPIHMMQSQFGMVPPLPPGVMPAPPGAGLPPRPLPPERPMFPSGMQGAPHSSTQLGNHGNQLDPKMFLSLGPPAPPPPLFPSGSVAASDRPDIRLPSNRKEVGYAVSFSESVKLMHPDNEISMEELRGVMPRYVTQQPLHMHPHAPPNEFHSAPLLYTRHPGIRLPEYGHMRMPYPYKQY